MKLYKIAQILENALEQVNDCIEEYGEEAEVHLECNTYYVKGNNFLGIAGYSDGGYLSLDNIEEAIDDDEDDEEIADD